MPASRICSIWASVSGSRFSFCAVSGAAAYRQIRTAANQQIGRMGVPSPTLSLKHKEPAENLSVNCSAGLQTGCTGGFLAARWDVCGSGGPHDSCSGERRYKIRYLRISSKSLRLDKGLEYHV